MSTKLKEVCRKHLETKGCTLWGQAFNIHDPKGLDAASEWLARQVRDVIVLRQEKMEEGDGDSQEAQQPQNGALAGVQ